MGWEAGVEEVFGGVREGGMGDGLMRFVILMRVWVGLD